MLASLVLILAADEPLLLPRALGRASHALLLRLIAEQQPALATHLHDGPGPKPFTCSELVGGRAQGDSQQVSPGQPVWIRFTGLVEPVSRVLQSLAENPPEEVELDRQCLRVVGATMNPAEHLWAGQTRYQALCDEFLAQRMPPRRLTLEHASPTTFRSQGVNIPVPLPYLVFGSLLGRWQAFAPVAVNADAQRYAEEMVALARYRLQTRLVRLEGRGMRVGFVGQSSYALLNRDRYWGNIMGLLVAYSFYAGLGGHTGMGMGQTRWLPEGKGW